MLSSATSCCLWFYFLLPLVDRTKTYALMAECTASQHPQRLFHAAYHVVHTPSATAATKLGFRGGIAQRRGL
jgi:hypothetical protein